MVDDVHESFSLLEPRDRFLVHAHEKRHLFPEKVLERVRFPNEEQGQLQCFAIQVLAPRQVPAGKQTAARQFPDLFCYEGAE